MALLMDFTDVGRTRMEQTVTDALGFVVTHIAYGSSGFNAGSPATALPLVPAATALVAETFRKEVPSSQITIDTVGYYRGQETVYTSLGGDEHSGILGEAGIIATVTDPGTTGLTLGDEFLLAQAHFGRICFSAFDRFAIKWPLDLTAPALIYSSTLHIFGDVVSILPVVLGPGFGAFALSSGSLPPSWALNAGTGEITGTATDADLLGGSPAGDYTGIVITGDATVDSPPFDIRILGVTMPDPASVGGVYLSADGYTVVGSEVINAVDGSRLDVIGPLASAAGLVAGESFDGDRTVGLRDNTTPLSKANKQFSALMTLQMDIKDASDQNVWAHGYGPGANTGIKLGYDSGADKFYAEWSGNAATTTLTGTTTPSAATTYTIGLSLREDTPPNQFGKLFVNGLKEDESASAHDVDFDTNPFEIGIFTDVAGESHYGKIDEFLWYPTVDLSEGQQATAHWLALRGETLASWILFAGPSTPTWADQVLANGSPISIFPLTPSSEPDGGTITYFVYDALPAGITLDTATGELSGTPTVNGNYVIQIGVTDGMNVVLSPAFTLNVS